MTRPARSPHRLSRPLAVATAITCVAAGALPAAAYAQAESDRTTSLLSRSAAGGLPNGPSRNATVSHDQRTARVMAYESEASDIVGGDSNGMTDVFVVHRAAPWSEHGSPWQIGRTEIASTGIGGQPANGRSYRPALDGDSHAAPTCVAFISEASNLVPGDTNGKPDAFVRHLGTGQIKRVSVDSAGRQANGSTSDVAVDGECERAAFVSDATNLALTRTTRLSWKSAVTGRARPGVTQVYVRVLRATKGDRAFKGLTFLASTARSRRAGNGPSSEVAFARAGKAVVFSSAATNLSGGDRSPSADVYRRSFKRKFRHIGGKGAQSLDFDTTLLSATPAGRAGNGPSTHPSASDDGTSVAYETLATDLLPGDSNGVSDIAVADANGRRVQQVWASKSAATGIGDGPSNRPEISGAGVFVLFDSEARNLKPASGGGDDTNGVRDVFLWNRASGNVSLESRDSDNGFLRSASQSPATSSRGNYVPFESGNPLIDKPLAATIFPQLVKEPSLLPPALVAPLLDPGAILPSLLSGEPPPPAGSSPTTEAVRAELAEVQRRSHQQVYLRYLGAK